MGEPNDISSILSLGDKNYNFSGLGKKHFDFLFESLDNPQVLVNMKQNFEEMLEIEFEKKTDISSKGSDRMNSLTSFGLYLPVSPKKAIIAFAK